jgi:hypothetical protein
VVLGQFRVPGDEEWIDALGLVPEQVREEEWVRRVEVTTDSGHRLELTYDVPGNSIYCRWRRDDLVLLEITREGARRLLVYSGQGEAHLLIEFEAEGLAGSLSIQVLPEIRIADKLLFV